MATYAIGDVQGCYQILRRLLTHINFDAERDELWFTGDLVNRGPDSLACLEFIKDLGNKAKVVLGNHDLTLIALSTNPELKAKHNLDSILEADNCADLIDWLRQQPLLIHDQNYVMVHAGIPPIWDLAAAKQHAAELEQTLRGDNWQQFAQNMFGNDPSIWSDDLSGWDRLRYITNAFTRMRFWNCKTNSLALELKSHPDSAAKDHLPWFAVPSHQCGNQQIIFGHWAALMGQAEPDHIFALDTGAVYGHALTALRLEDQKLFSVTGT